MYYFINLIDVSSEPNKFLSITLLSNPMGSDDGDLFVWFLFQIQFAMTSDYNEINKNPLYRQYVFWVL